MQPQTQTPEPQTQPEQNQPEQQNQNQSAQTPSSDQPTSANQLDDFLNNLLNDKGITNVEPDARAYMIDELRTLLLQQINKQAIMRLTDEQADELDKLSQDPNFTSEQFAQFLQNAGVNLAEVTVDTMIKFRSFYLGVQE